MAVNETTLIRRSQKVTEPAPDASVADRVRYLITLLRKTQQQFAESLNIDGPNLSRILNGHTPFTDAMINRIVVNLGVSKEWLLTGADVPFPRERHYSVEAMGNSAVTKRLNHVRRGAPVYDIDVTAGFTELSSMFTDDRIVGWLDLPSVPSENALVRVSGDSMIPHIADGAFVSIRKIRVDAPIYWGKMYLVVMEDYRMVKVLRRHKDENKVILHSYNPEYDDMDVDRSDIKSLYIVDAILNYQILS